MSGTATEMSLRVNGDSAADMYQMAATGTNATGGLIGQGYNNTFYRLTSLGGGGTLYFAVVEIENATLASAKFITSKGAAISGQEFTETVGMYRGTAAVNSITIFTIGAGLFTLGFTAYLLGAN
jgi:hypothetical protein